MRALLPLVWLLAEAWTIVVASGYFGGLVTFVLLLLIAALGLRLMRSQGLRAVANIQQAMQQDQLPAAAMFDSLIVFAAGGLLVLPGFLSDILALVLIFGGLRRRVARWAERYVAQQHPDYQRVGVIEGQFYTVSEPDQAARAEPIRHDGPG